MIDWNIQSRGHACHLCAKPFTDGQHYHTVLCDHRHEYERIDVCEPCWTAQAKLDASQRKGFISQWQGVYHAPPAAPPEAIQKDTADTLLTKLVKRNDPRFRAASFILAVMLERKRILKVRGQTTENGRRVFIYEHSRSGDVFTILDPDLQLNQLEEVQREVAHLLEHGFNGFGDTPASASDSPAAAATGEIPANDAPAAPARMDAAASEDVAVGEVAVEETVVAPATDAAAGASE